MEIDGQLWIPGGGQETGVDAWRTGYFVSHDNGKTWPEWQTVCTGLRDEKDILELPDKSLLAMIRSGKETYRCYSSDRLVNLSAHPSRRTWSRRKPVRATKPVPT